MQRKADTKRFIYGTAKLGDFSYGFSKNKKLDTEKRVNLLNNLIELGITRFDTSPRYKDAEKYLGEIISNSQSNLLIDSKVIDLKPQDPNSENMIFNQVKKSLKTLNLENLNVLYLHQNQMEILMDKYIQKGLEKILEKGLAKKIGISVYNHIELDYGINNDLFNVIQAPINILNNSFYKKFNQNKKSLKKELVARSIFIQGTLFSSDILKLKKLNFELHEKIQLLSYICKENKTSIENEAKYSVLSLKRPLIIQSSLSINNLKKNISYISNKNNIIVQQQIINILDREYTFTNPRNWNNSI